MAQRRFHYEQAFEAYLRSNRIPYIAVDEARKTLLPADQPLPSLKSFDFVVSSLPGHRTRRLVDVKGRLFKRGRQYQNWVTLDDIEALGYWEQILGEGFVGTFVFIFALEQQPPDALFESVFAHAGRWYALREISLDDYRREMRPRSPKWRTVSLAGADFERLSRPFGLSEAPAAPKNAIFGSRIVQTA